MRSVVTTLVFTLCFCSIATADLNPTQTLSEVLGNSDMPKIAIEDGSIYAIWRGDIFINGVQQSKVLFRRSVDGGNSWRKTRNLSNEWAGNDVAVRKELRSPDSVDLTTFDGNIYAVWSQPRHLGPQTGNYEIYGVRSTNFGEKFERMESIAPDFTISNTENGDSICPTIAAHGNFVYVAWLDNQTSGGGTGPFQIWYTYSDDGGKTFKTPNTIEDLTSSAIDFEVTEMDCPQLVVTGSTVIIGWVNFISGQARVSYLRSNNSGVVAMPADGDFGAILNIDTSSDARKENLTLAAEGNLVVAAWQESEGNEPFQVRVFRSLDRGFTFPNEDEGTLPDTNIQKFPSLHIWDGSVWLALTEEIDDQFDVVLLRSEDSAFSFMEVENVSNNNSISIHPAIVARNGMVHVLWMDNSTSGIGPHQFRINYRNSSPLSSFDSRILSQDLGISSSAELAMSGSNVYAVWKSDQMGTGVSGGRIIFARSTDFGITFEPIVGLSEQSAASEVADPAIVARGNFVVLAWAQRACDNCPFDIMLEFSKDGGASFTPPAAIGTGTNISRALAGCQFEFDGDPIPYSRDGNDRMPSLAMSDKFLYLVWSSDIKGSFDIFYTRWELSAIFRFATIIDPESLDCPGKDKPDSVFYDQSQFLALTEVEENQGPDERFEDDLQPFISVNGPTVAISWYATGVELDEGDIYMAMTDFHEGNNLDENDPEPLEIDPDDNDAIVGEIRCPGIIVYQSRVLAVWSQFVNGNSQIYFAEGELTDSEPDFEDPIPMTSSTAHSCPTIVRGNSNVFVAWHGREAGGNYDINLLANPRLDEDADNQIFDFINISNTPGDSEFVALALDDNDRVFAIWMDKSSGKPEIFFEANVDVTGAGEIESIETKSSSTYSGPLAIRMKKSTDTIYVVRSQAIDAVTMHIDVFDLHGNRVVSESTHGNQLAFKMRDKFGRPMANGIYLYVVHAKRADGSIARSEVRKLLVMR